MILYEYPFNERVRTYLRLEHLFQRLAELMRREHCIDHHYAIATMFEVMDVATRADLKTDVLKDLEKQKHVLNSFRGNPSISEEMLDEITAQLERCFTNLGALPGKVGQALTENDWLMAVRSRIGIPGGTCEFDLPSYFAWQHIAPDSRQKDLLRWVSNLMPMSQSVDLLLKLLREAGAPQKMGALGGQYQQTLPQGRTFQLLRLRMDQNLGVVPEISGNRLLVSVRFMRQDNDGRMQASADDVEFEMALCQ